MYMKPMYFGEDAVITLPSGEEVVIFLSGHRSSRNEPIVGFQTPEGSTIRRKRMQQYLELFLQQVHIFQISCEGREDVLVVSAKEMPARRRYRQRFPDRGPITVRVLEESPDQPFSDYPWYGMLQRLYDQQVRPPFFIDEVP